MTDSLLDSLWGAKLDRIDVDVVRHVVEMWVEVTTRAVQHRWQVTFHSVTELRFFSSIPDPWNYAELTEIYATRLANQRIRVEIVLWSEDAGLTLEAGSVQVDGRTLAITDT